MTGFVFLMLFMVTMIQSWTRGVLFVRILKYSSIVRWQMSIPLLSKTYFNDHVTGSVKKTKLSAMRTATYILWINKMILSSSTELINLFINEKPVNFSPCWTLFHNIEFTKPFNIIKLLAFWARGEFTLFSRSEKV